MINSTDGSAALTSAGAGAGADGLPSVSVAVAVTLLVSTLVLGVFLNGAVVASVRRNRRLWTLTNGLLACSAALTLFTTAFGVPIHLATVLLHPKTLPKTFCFVHSIGGWIGKEVASAVLSTVACLMFRTVCAKQNCLLRGRRLLLWFSPSIVTALLFTSAKFSFTQPNILCLHRQNLPNWSLGEYLTVTSVLSQTVVLAYSYTRIACTSIRKRSTCTCSVQPVSGHRGRTVKRHRLRVDLVTTSSCFVQAVLAILFFAPVEIFFHLANNIFKDEKNWTVALSLVISIDHVILALKDPIVYLATCKILRDEIVAILLCMRTGRKKLDIQPPDCVISRVTFTVRAVENTSATVI